MGGNAMTGLMPLLLVASLAGSGADVGSTAYATHHGAHEANRVVAPAVVPLALGLDAGFHVATWRLRTTHPKWAGALMAGWAVAHAGIAVHNLRAAR